MKMIAALFCLILVLGSATAAPIRAQTPTSTPPPDPYCYLVINDFTELEANGKITSGATQAGGSSLPDVHSLNSNGAIFLQGAFVTGGGIHIEVDLDIPSGWNRLVVDYDRAQTRTSGTNNGLMTRSDGGAWYTHFVMSNGGTPSSPLNFSYSIHASGEGGAGDYDIKLGAANNAANSAFLRLNSLEFRYDCENEASFTADPLTGGAPLTVAFTNTSTGEALGYAWSFTHGDMGCITGTIESTAHSPTFTYDEPGTYTVCLKVTFLSGTDIAYETIVVTDTSPGAASLVAPLSPEDRNQELHNLQRGMYSRASLRAATDWESDPLQPIHDEDVVFALSNKDSASVMAAADGEVISVSPISYDECEMLIGGLAQFAGMGHECWYIIPSPVHNSPIPVFAFRIALINAYSVKVRFSDNYWIQYWVRNPTVAVGDTINAGCALGETLTLFPVADPFIVNLVLNFFGAKLGISNENGSVSKFSISVIASLNLLDATDIDPLLPALQIDMLPTGRCDQTPSYSACIGDAEMRNQSIWTSNGSVIWDADGSGVTLYYGGSILDHVLLNAENEYGLDVNIERLLDLSSSVSLALGSTRVNLQLLERSAVYSIPADEHPPDAGLFHSIYIENTGQAPIHITRACVSEGGGTGDGIPVSGTCQLRNFAFVYGLEGWTASGVTANPGVYRDVITAVNGGTLFQTVTMATGNNRVDVNYRVNGLNMPTFEYTLDGGDTWTAMSTDYSSNPLNRTASASFNMAIAVPTEFGIRVSLSSGTTTIEQICITPENLPTGGAIGHLPFFDMKCKSENEPPAPDIINPGPWLFWHYSKLEQFLTCDLMILLNKMHMTMLDGLDFMRWQMLYWQSAANMWGKWIGASFIPYLNGHWTNMAQGRVTVINGDEQCNNVFCLGQSVIDGLVGFVGQRVDTIINLVSSAVNLIASLFARIFEAINVTLAQGVVDIASAQIDLVVGLYDQAKSYLDAIIIAWQVSTPTPIPGLPNCTFAPQSSTFCMFIWVLDNTILTGRGALLIPIIIGIGSVCVLIIAFKMVRRAMERAAQLS